VGRIGVPDRAVGILRRRGVARDGCSMGFSGRPQVCPCVTKPSAEASS
jgi:hypothetical protein